MPIYEYCCKSCGHEFEIIQKITDKPIKKCEKCGKLQAKRMISQTSFILKGSGWYVTDYSGKKPSDSKSPNTDKTSNNDTSSSDNASDTKPSKSPDPPKKAANA